MKYDTSQHLQTSIKSRHKDDGIIGVITKSMLNITGQGQMFSTNTIILLLIFESIFFQLVNKYQIIPMI